MLRLPFRAATPSSCSPRGACAPITSRLEVGSALRPGTGTTFALETQLNQWPLAR